MIDDLFKDLLLFLLAAFFVAQFLGYWFGVAVPMLGY